VGTISATSTCKPMASRISSLRRWRALSVNRSPLNRPLAGRVLMCGVNAELAAAAGASGLTGTSPVAA
jgi:hypothetical protein